MEEAVTFLDRPVSFEQVADLNDGPPLPGFFSATVRGEDEEGAAFESDVPLDGHLDGNLYLRLGRGVRPRSELFIVLRLKPALDLRLPALRVTLRGRVNLVKSLPTGGSELRVGILDYRKL